MSEGLHNDNDDFDVEDVEHRLYAAIHHESNYTNNANAIEPDPQAGDNAATTNRRPSVGGGARQFQRDNRSAKRYWNVAGGSPAMPSPAFKDRQPRPANSNGSSPFAAKEAPATLLLAAEPVAMATPTSFTPYVSMLAGSAPTPAQPSDSVDAPAKNTLKETNKHLKTTATSAKNVNPFSKKAVTHMYKETVGTVADVGNNAVKHKDDGGGGQPKAKKRANPYAQQHQQKAKKDKKAAAKERPAKSKAKGKASDSSCVIDLDATIDDDDVIILPTEEPPLICVDSSDDEAAEAPDHAFAEPTARNRKSKATGSRCASPSSSIQSADDFLVQPDRHCISFDASLTFDDSHSGSETVADSLRQAGASEPSTSKAAAADAAVFTAPRPTAVPADKGKEAGRKTYEVSDNSFVAVDVYESESSDMPDSIYGKGSTLKRTFATNSDSSDVQDVNVFKPKKLKKRKCSGSAKEVSDDSSSDLPFADSSSDDDAADDGDAYLVRGEALGRVRKNGKRKSKNRKKSSGKSSDDEFIMKLASIVNDGAAADVDDDDDADDQDHETSAETVDARHIVETVLERRTKRLKSTTNNRNDSAAKGANVDRTDKPADEVDDAQKSAADAAKALEDGRTTVDQATDKEQMAENGRAASRSPAVSNQWTVTDEVGETDELPATLDTDNSKEQAECSSSTEPAAPTHEPPADTASDADAPQEIYGPLDAEIGWNDEMKRFYNESWGGELFSLRSVQSRMRLNKRGSKWKLHPMDRRAYVNRKNVNVMCTNCKERGHKRAGCYRPPIVKRCAMCGRAGHQQSRCPNKMCLVCGRRMHSFTNGCDECSRDRGRFCFLCKCKGHLQTACPDQWRRYHAITDVNEPLKQQQQPKSTKAKVKYCALCSRRGHLAEQCSTVHARFPISTLQVASYTPLYNAAIAPQTGNRKQYTILTSKLGNCSFEFGDVVSGEPNTIYGRFRQAVNLHEPHDAHTATVALDQSIEILETSRNEYSAPDSSIDIDAEASANLDALRWLPGTSFDQTADEIAGGEPIELDQSSEHLEPQADDKSQQNITVDSASDKSAGNESPSPALGAWEHKMQTLADLRAIILQPPAVPNEATHRDEKDESDSNYSFSEHFNQSPTKKGAVSTTQEPDYLPDFIPLPADRTRSRSRSQSPVSADTTTDSLGDANCDATIHLTKAHCNHLIKPHGSEALRGLQTKNSVTVEMEWRATGNVLRVHGTPANQDHFHRDLTEFLKTLVESASPANNTTMMRVPRQKNLMISFLREHLSMLGTPAYYNRDLRKVHQTMLASLANNNKRGVREAYRCRRILNAVLFGRHGFGDGEMHLAGLQDKLAKVINVKSHNLSKAQFTDLGKHFEYIFTEFDHKNYPDLLDQYYNLKVARQLRVLSVDRRLLGFPISVVSTTPPSPPPPPCISTSTPAPPKRPNVAQHASDESITSTQFNTMPSSHDIQLNISNSSMDY